MLMLLRHEWSEARDFSSPLLFSIIAFKYPARKSQENQEGWELNGTHHVLFCSNGRLLSENINMTKGNKQVLLDVSKEIGLVANNKRKLVRLYVHVSSQEYRTK
jgi:hypothetical protein